MLRAALRTGVLLALSFPLAAMQAAVEYALKSGTSAVNGAGKAEEGMRLGVCPMNQQVLSCVSQHYPIASIVVVIVAFLLLLRFAYRRPQI